MYPNRETDEEIIGRSSKGNEESSSNGLPNHHKDVHGLGEDKEDIEDIGRP